MADKTSLPAGWQTLLENPAGAKPYLEVVFDPDDENLTLSGKHALLSIDNVVGSVDIDPEFASELVFRDIVLTFSDPDEYYGMMSSRASRLFKRIQRVLAESTFENPVGLRDGIGTFAVGDEVTFTDGDNTDTVTLTAASSSQIGWNGALSHTYLAGDIVSTTPILGKEVVVYLKLEDDAGSLVLFRGVIREPFKWDGNTAKIKIDNLLGKVLDKPLRTHASSQTPTERMALSGNLESTFVWNDGATTSLSGVTVYADAELGEWTVVLLEGGVGYKALLVHGPRIGYKTGRTDQNFYDNNDATDSQICIPAANWTTPTAGDTLTFRVCANFEDKTVPEILYELLNSYGGIGSSLLDVGGTGITDGAALTYSFNKAYDVLQAETFTFSYDKPMTIMEAILIIQPHSLCYLGQMVGGKLCIFTLNAYFEMASITPTVVGNPAIDHTDLVNEVIVKYGWDYEAEDYLYEKKFPEYETENPSMKLHGRKVQRILHCPAMIT